MPQKSLPERLRRAKRGGAAPGLKESELGAERHAVSAHGAKKSRHLARYATPPDRHLGVKKPPGAGAWRGRKLDLREAYRAENAASGGGRPRRIHHEEHPRPVAKVQGRKKPPSRMNLKARGGPSKRLPLHEG